MINRNQLRRYIDQNNRVRMNLEILNFDEYLNENEDENSSLNEDTIEGYTYHFDYNGKTYKIHQGKEDKTIFGVKKDGKWKAMTKGDLFDAKKHSMTRDEMIKFLQKGIKFFNIRSQVDIDILRDSQWAKFFDFEIKKRPGRINKKYVILKLHCGKAACKWLAKH